MANVTHDRESHSEVINHITINSTFKQSFHPLSQLLFIIHCMIILLGHQFDYPGPRVPIGNKILSQDICTVPNDHKILAQFLMKLKEKMFKFKKKCFIGKIRET